MDRFEQISSQPDPTAAALTPLQPRGHSAKTHGSAGASLGGSLGGSATGIDYGSAGLSTTSKGATIGNPIVGGRRTISVEDVKTLEAAMGMTRPPVDIPTMTTTTTMKTTTSMTNNDDVDDEEVLTAEQKREREEKAKQIRKLLNHQREEEGEGGEEEEGGSASRRKPRGIGRKMALGLAGIIAREASQKRKEQQKRQKANSWAPPKDANVDI